jgi:hypothetical protein
VTSVCLCVGVNRSDIIGIRSSVIVRIAVVVRISSIGSGNHLQRQTYCCSFLLFERSFQSIVAFSPRFKAVYHPYNVLNVERVFIVWNSQSLHDALIVRQNSVARSDSFSDDKSSFFPFSHADRIDRVRDLDVVQKLVCKIFQCAIPYFKEDAILLRKLSFCEEVMLNESIDTVSQLEVDHFELDLAFVTFTFYNTHFCFLIYSEFGDLFSPHERG